jgi:hypothetical protein
VTLIFDPKNPEEVKRVHEFATILAKYEIIQLIFITPINF